MPRISVIIPIYNTARYLADCLESVVSQATAANAEIICINDGSTDDSMQVLQPYLARYANISLISRSNAGLSAARNAGMERAQGDYLIFLDSDDMLVPGALCKLLQAMPTPDNPDIIAFGSELWYDEGGGRRTPNWLFNHLHPHLYATGMDYLDHFVQTRGWGPSAACFYAYRRSLIMQNRLRFPRGLLHEDELFVPQAVSMANGVYTIPDMLYVYRMRSASIVHTETEKHYHDKLFIAHRLEHFWKQRNELNPTTRRIIYSLSLNAMLGLRKQHLSQPFAEWKRLWQLADSWKTRAKLIKKIFLSV